VREKKKGRMLKSGDVEVRGLKKGAERKPGKEQTVIEILRVEKKVEKVKSAS